MTTAATTHELSIDGLKKPAWFKLKLTHQLLARVTGFLFVVTFLTSIPPVVWFYVPVLSDPAYILGAGDGSRLSWGALLEMMLIIANIGTAVALFSVIKRIHEPLALGFVTARLMESFFIAVGLLSLLAIGELRQDAAGLNSAALLVTGRALVALHDWTFLLGPGFVVGIGNGLILAYLMWTSRLVPRALSILGLLGGTLLILTGAAILVGFIEPLSIWQIIATVPEFFWELGLGFWLMIKGFDEKALAALPGRAEGAPRQA